ncbi:hypothetical protein CROQUDRAFT_405826 [Cronartium quercuum f. sp. fusiforme G11]|uniref:CCHC-type domain-containing protein n=1 Tax=Cronartium quercuum f. sp. fusiforme G11 TaxID=708437 RepID=A0A9P6THQ1_9BASI|nr:hypothetical protein CROQUDRAFT_405826 [Cronartium quercuum f. sp. fusiforme G11]
MITCSKAQQPPKTPTEDTSNMASRPTTPPHATPLYKSVDFFMRMPSMMKHSVVTLDPAGTKFISWKMRLWDTVDFVTKIKNYLVTDRPADEEHYDEVIRSMIMCSIDESFIAQIERSWSAKKTFDYIVSMFHFPSRTSHVTTWLEMGNTKFTPGDSLNEYLSRVRAKVDELDRTGFEWTRDSFLSMQMQLGLPTSGEFSFNNVNMILDARLRHSHETKITARETEEAIRAEYHRMGATDPSTLPNIAALQLGGNRQQPTYRIPAHQEPRRSYPPQTHPPQQHQRAPPSTQPIRSTATNNNDRYRYCFCCGGEGHWATACEWNPESPNYTGNRARQSNRPPRVGANLANIECPELEPDGPLPEGIFTSEGALTEPWKEDHGMVDTADPAGSRD